MLYNQSKTAATAGQSFSIESKGRNDLKKKLLIDLAQTVQD